jgi:hypothetical protein
MPIRDLTPIEGLPLRILSPPTKENLTPESLKILDAFQKAGRIGGW